MKVLWVVGFVVPQVSDVFECRTTDFGGWVGSMITQLESSPEIELGVAMRAPLKEHKRARVGNVNYYALPQCGKNNQDIPTDECRYALSDFEPDLLHIEGTECAHARTFLKCWSGRNVIEIQGIISGHRNFQFGGLHIGKMLMSNHPVKVMAALALIFRRMKNCSKQRLRHETDTIQMAHNLIGRTTWDRAYTHFMNPQARYFHCNHVLRSVFYRESWSPDKYDPHIMFIGNAQSPLKGAHFAFQAAALLKKEYPDLKVIVAGESPYMSSLSQFKKWSGYAAYLRLLVNELNLNDSVQFTGVLNSEKMAQQMCRAHVFVHCSIIENSPTTLSEAMLLGVPTVTSFVGGIPDMASDNEEVLFYREEDHIHLAYQIKRIFDDEKLAIKLSEKSHKRAKTANNLQNNKNTMLDIYKKIIVQ